MKPQTRQTVLIGVMLVMLAIAGVWNVRWMLRQQVIAEDASQDLAGCRMVAEAIEALREQPAVASAQAMGDEQALGVRIGAAAKQAHLSGSWYKGTYPQSPRRMGDSPYLQHATVLSMQDLSLQQLAEFLYHLTEGSGLTVRDLRLRSPLSESTGGQWDAEATLTYLTYAPPTESRRGR